MFYDVQKIIAEGLKSPYYYKNILLEEYHAEFEKILKSIQHDLKLFHKNLIYTKKIFDFINVEFKNEGIFPQELIFLQLFITNTVDSMILTTYKLALDNANIQTKKNGGLSYLKSLINTKMLNDKVTKENSHKKLKEVKPLFKKYESLSKEGKIDVLRNSKIAHYDIGKQEELKQIRVNLETLQKIYNVSVQIFEILSLKYFEYNSTFDYMMIESNSFEKFICQNAMMNNPNPHAQLDIDNYFMYLRQKFISQLSNTSFKPL